MGSSAQNSVHYCCVWKGGRAAYAYHGSGNNGENPEITESLARSCLELTPPHHKWYIERMGKRAFGFLIEDGYVYFLISDHAFRNKAILAFLHNLRDEFMKRKSTDQLVPVIHRLITSLGNVSGGGGGGGASELSPSPEGNTEVAKAPLLGRSEKKKKKEHVIGIELEAGIARKSTSSSRELIRQASNSSSSSTAPQLRSSSSRHLHVRKRWCRQVKIVIAVDVAVCLVLLGVWLGICRGFKCIS